MELDKRNTPWYLDGTRFSPEYGTLDDITRYNRNWHGHYICAVAGAVPRSNQYLRVYRKSRVESAP